MKSEGTGRARLCAYIKPSIINSAIEQESRETLLNEDDVEAMPARPCTTSQESRDTQDNWCTIAEHTLTPIQLVGLGSTISSGPNANCSQAIPNGQRGRPWLNYSKRKP